MKKKIVTMFAVVLPVASMAVPVSSETLSNRHHLSGCVDQSSPVVIPYANVRTVRLGLPADVDGRARVAEIYGYDEETRLRLRRRGVSVHTQGGGARLVMPHQSGC